MEQTIRTDQAAAALSLACIAHCLALPIFAASLPLAATLAEAEWIHWILAALAVLASGSIAWSSKSARTPMFLVPAMLGGSLVVGGLFAENLGVDEVMPTVIGGVLLVFAHLQRLLVR